MIFLVKKSSWSFQKGEIIFLQKMEVSKLGNKKMYFVYNNKNVSKENPVYFLEENFNEFVVDISSKLYKLFYLG